MKIKLPFRETYTVFAFLFVCCFPNIIVAQCDKCDDNKVDLTGCPTTGNDGEFNLNLVAIDGANHAVFYDNCNGNGSLNSNDIIASPYTAEENDKIYVEELNASDSCINIIEVTLKFTNASVSITSVPTSNAFCSGGFVDLTAIPSNEIGTPAYVWTTPSVGSPTGENINAATAGNYSVMMTDDLCTVTSTVVAITDESVVIADTDRTNVSCNGLSDGTFSVTITGGTGPFDYVLSTGGTPITMNNVNDDMVTFTGLPMGTYSVAVTDDNGAMCMVNSSGSPLAITEPDAMGLTLAGVPPLISGGDGMIDVLVTGGNSPFDWAISGSSSNSSTTSPFTIPNVSPGTYTVTVTDNSSCTNTGVVTVLDLDCSGLSITGTTTTPPQCTNSVGGSKGKITVTTMGYSPNYTIVVNGPDDVTMAGNSTDVVDVNNLSNGTYGITVTDAAGCTATASSVVIANPDQITFSLSEAQKACTGDDNGAIQVSGITNGSGTYTVTWTGPGPDGSVGPFTANNVVLPGLLTGTFTVIITDSNGCTPNSDTQFVGELDAISVVIEGDDVFCFDEGNGTLTTNPTAGLSHAWSTGATSPSISIPNPGSMSDTYTVIVTDAAGCTGDDAITVSRLQALTVSLNTSASKTSVTCSSDCDGRIQLNVSGATGVFSYSWTGPMGFSASSKDIDDLCPGDYAVTITDTQEECTATFSQNISVPEGITASASASDAQCNGDSNGAVTVDADGGTGQYDYLWTPGGQITQSISGLSAGTYTVRVTDESGCFVNESATVNEPNPVVGIIAASDDEICFGESISLTVSGGTSFAWSNGLGTNATVSVSPTSTTIYSCIVTDAATNNCTDLASIEIKVNNLPTAAILVAESSGLENNDKDICEGDPVTISATGGVTYNWEGGRPNPFTVSPSSGTESYAVTVTDANGCTDTELVEVVINQNPTPVINFSSSSQAVGDVQNIGNSSIANCGTIVECDWKTDGTPVANGDCDGISPTFTSEGAKSILLSVLNSCGCTEEVSSDLEIFASDACAVEEFTVNNSLGVACVGEDLDIITKERAAPNCSINSQGFNVFEGGVLLTPGEKYVYTIDKIKFLAPGNYNMEYSVGDNCGCSRTSKRNIVVSAAPTISFLAGNPTMGCEGETVNVKFGGFDTGEKVQVMFTDGSTFSYELDNFDLQLGVNLKETLTIISVQNSICDADITGQTLEINVTPEFEILSQSTDCTDDGLSYSLTIKTAGGDASASIIADGILGTTSGADNYIIPNLDPTKEYSFSLSRGPTCDPITVNIPMIICNCTFFVGDFNPNTSYSGCEGGVFEIPNIFNPSVDFDPESDTLIYVLHNQQTGLSLGKVSAVYPITTTQISSDFQDFKANIPYRLSVVGVRRATLDDFDFDNPSSLSNAGAGRCLSVVSGIPIVWFRTPAPEIATANNSAFICRNAYDFMLFVKSSQNQGDLSFSVEGVPDENIKYYGFQDTVFIYFEDNGQDSFIVTVTETKVNSDGGASFTCEGSTTMTLYVADGPGSPPVSDIILWPGNILASTADSSTTCFAWGFENFGQTSFFGTDKYLYAASDIDFTQTTRTYFVDTYFCDNPGCVTRIYFNDDGPSPGLNYEKEETFSYLVKPNPNRGLFTLDLFSDVAGDFSLKIIDITGKPVLDKRAKFNIGHNKEEFNLTDVPKGLYFIQIMNTELNEYSINKIVIN